jgi:O-antigen/teichoic acid export membrane protein
MEPVLVLRCETATITGSMPRQHGRSAGAAGTSSSTPTRSPDPTELTRTVVGGISVTTLGLVGSRVLTLVSYLVLARLAAPEVFGRFAAGSVLLGVAGIFVESGMLAALIQRRDRLAEAADTAFVSTMLGGAALSLCALAASPLVGLVFSSHEIGLVAAAMSGVLLVGAATVVPDALLQRRFSFLRRVLVDPVGALVFGVTSIVALAYGMGVWALVLGTYASELAQVAASWKASGFRPHLRGASMRMWKELAGYGRHVLAGTFIDHIGLATTTVIVGRLVSTSALGQFRYAQRLGTVPQDLAMNAGSYVLLPAFARISHDQVRFERAFLRSLRWALVAVVPASLLLLPLGRPLVVLLLGDRWRPAGEALMVLSIWSAPRVPASVAAESLKAAGRPDILPPLQLLQTVLAIVFMLALFPLGLIGVAAGLAVASVLAEACTVWRAAKVLRFSGRAVVAAVWPPYVAALPMVAALFAIDRLLVHAERHGVGVGLVLVALEGLLGLAVYIASLAVVARPTVAELAGAVRVVRARVRGRLAPHASALV